MNRILTKKAMQPRNSNETTTAAKEAIVMFRQNFLSLVCLFADMFLFCLILLTHWFTPQRYKNIDYLVTYTLKIWQKK